MAELSSNATSCSSHTATSVSSMSSFVSHEMNVIRRAGAATKGHARKISRVILDAAWNVCHFDSLPNWMQDNDFIANSHRPQLNCFRTCAMSIFRLHSETGNIWTHLIGCLVMIGLSIWMYHFSPIADNLRLTDKLIFGFYFLTATVCMAFSTIFHTFSCHSREVGRMCSK